MSGRCTGWVLKHGPQDRAMRAVLIVIADAANSDGEHSHPGLDNLIEGSLYKRSHVLATLAKLEEEQWIEVAAKHSPGRATTFNVLMDRPLRQVQSLDLSGPVTGPIRDGHRSNPPDSQVQSANRHTSSLSTTVSTTVSTTGRDVEVLDSFDQFWLAYPRHVGKGAARRAWDTALKKTDVNALVASARAYANTRAGQDPQYTPHASTWLNGERWTDDTDERHRPEPRGFAALRSFMANEGAR